MESVKSTTLVSATAAASSDSTAQSQAASSGLPSSGSTQLVILSIVLSVVAILFLAGMAVMCLRRRSRQFLCFNRGLSPVDDDEIATWKMSAAEKADLVNAVAVSPGSPGYIRRDSTSSVQKPPSVIVYPSRNSHHLPRHSESGSPRSAPSGYGVLGRSSVEKELPRTPLQAVAPNARAGLTDETVPGDVPFLPSPKRHPSRFSRSPPTSSQCNTRTHTRTRSLWGSTRSLGDYGYCAGPDIELLPRVSHEQYSGRRRDHSRIYSSPSLPPRRSLGDDYFMAGLSPRPLNREGEIGRAIG